MTKPLATSSAPGGEPIRFEVRAGIRRVSCTVADDALEAVSGLSAPSTPALRRESFDRFRMLIDAAAKLKAASVQDGFAGPMVLSIADLRRVPAQTGMTLFGNPTRRPAKPATETAAEPETMDASATG